MYSYWRYYFKIKKNEGKYTITDKTSYRLLSIEKFNTKKEARDSIKASMKEHFQPLHKLALYWIAIGLFTAVFFLSPFIIGKFMHGGLMELSVPRSVSKYISMGSMLILFYGCIATPKINEFLFGIEVKIQNFILKD